ncbi:MAG: hypothetical protein IMF16_04950 [Proteobacteria bacterium]|nr:hypothetical protein [Pseudomonadota bacterium]
MPATGTVVIGGKELTWRSPLFGALVEFEAQVGPLIDVDIVNSVKGRRYMAYLCLREDNPDLTLDMIDAWPADAFVEVWEMIMRAIPIFIRTGARQDRPGAKRPPEEGPGSDAGRGSATRSSSTSPASSDGGPPASEESA